MTSWFESQLDTTGSENKQHKLASESTIACYLNEITHQNVLSDIKHIVETYPEIALESLNHLIEYTSLERIREVVGILSKKLSTLEQQQQQQQLEAAQNIQVPCEPTSETFSVAAINTSTPKVANNRSGSTSASITDSPQQQSSPGSTSSRK